MRNNLKAILQNKQKTISRLTGYPSNKSGQDGDFQVRRIPGQGIFLFYKWGTKWYSSRLTQYRPRTAEHKQKVKIPIGVSPSANGELSIDSTGNLAVKKSNSKLNHIISVDKDGIADAGKIELSRTFSSTSSMEGNMVLKNTTDDSASANAWLTLYTTKGTLTDAADSYINYVYDFVSEGRKWSGWCVGMDGSDTKMFKWLTHPNTGVASTVPSTEGLGGSATRCMMELDTSGNLGIKGNFTTYTTSQDTSGSTSYFLALDGTEMKKVSTANVRASLGIADDEIIDWTASSAGTIHATNYVDNNTNQLTTFTVSATTDTNATTISQGDDLMFTAGTGITCETTADGTVTIANTVSAPTNYITNDADDTMAGTLTIDKNLTNTTTATESGLYIDCDHVGLLGASQTLTAIGLDLDMNCNLGDANHALSTLTQTGIDVTLVATTDGSQINTGIRTNVSGGDKNFDIQLTHDSTNYCTMATGADGATTIKTVDSDGAQGHLTLNPDGDLIVLSADVKISSAKKLYLDAGGDTYIYQSTADILDFYAGNVNMLKLDEANDKIQFTGGAIELLDTTDAADLFSITVAASGVTTIATVDDGAAVGHLNIEADGHVEFDGCAVGFDRILAADAADVAIDFRTGNKAHLDMTGGSISGTLTLQFPATSGNFVLIVQQDGSTRTIAAYATKDSAGNAGDNDGGTAGKIRWQGGDSAGSNPPDLTDGGNKRDVLSFYWDADEEVCYGVASLDF